MSIKNCHTQHNEACVNALRRCIEPRNAGRRAIHKNQSSLTSSRHRRLDRGFLPVTFTTVFGLPDKATTRHKNSYTRGAHTHIYTRTLHLTHTHTHREEREMKLCLVCWFGFSCKLHVAKAAKTKARARQLPSTPTATPSRWSVPSLHSICCNI